MFVNDCLKATREWLAGHPMSFVNAGIHYETNFKYYADFNPFDVQYVVQRSKKYLGFPPHFDGWEVCYLDNSFSHAYAAGHVKNYMAIGGKDERMTGWGYEDTELRSRMFRNGYTHDTTNNIAVVHVGHGLVRTHPWGYPEDRDVSASMAANQAIEAENNAKNLMVANAGKEWGTLQIEKEYRWV